MYQRQLKKGDIAATMMGGGGGPGGGAKQTGGKFRRVRGGGRAPMLATSAWQLLLGAAELHTNCL